MKCISLAWLDRKKGNIVKIFNDKYVVLNNIADMGVGTLFFIEIQPQRKDYSANFKGRKRRYTLFCVVFLVLFEWVVVIIIIVYAYHNFSFLLDNNVILLHQDNSNVEIVAGYSTRKRTITTICVQLLLCAWLFVWCFFG